MKLARNKSKSISFTTNRKFYCPNQFIHSLTLLVEQPSEWPLVTLSRLVDLCHSATRSSSSAPDELLSPQSLNRMAKGYSLIVYYSTGDSSSAISSPFTVLLAKEEDALCCRQFRKAGSSWTAEPSSAPPLPLEIEMMKTNILFFLFAVVALKTIPAAAPWRRCPLNDDMYTYLNWTADKQAKESLPMDTRCNFPDP